MSDFIYLVPKSASPSRALDTFPRPENVVSVQYISHELTAFCPVTHQPDFYTATIEYQPDQLCIESKSLKLFLWSYRDEQAFAETLASNIAQAIYTACQPNKITVTLTQNVRGGLELTAVAEFAKP